MNLRLDEVAAALGLAGSYARSAITGWSVDSRTIQPGDLFFALKGPRHDGHEHVADAFARGAVAAVVDRAVDLAGPLLLTPDAGEALLTLAAWARRRWGGTVAAVTGSAGKTTTKEVIAHLLGSQMRVGKTEGNYNNHVGLPLSILRLPESCRLAVLEIGMNHAGEIRRLAGAALPDVGVVTNVGYAHLENFESIEGIAAAKRELIESLRPEGVAILNADDARVLSFRQVHAGRTITYGVSPEADVRAVRMELLDSGSRFQLDTGEWLETVLCGRHSVSNILAGVAVARAFGIDTAKLLEAVRTLRAGPMRGEKFVHDGITILNDCYNSNPDAARAMLETLRDTPAKRRIAVLGEMLELGDRSRHLHREIGAFAAACGVDHVVGIRGAARDLVSAAVESGLPEAAAHFFERPGDAGVYLKGVALAGDAVLFKGSRGVRVEEALASFMG